MRRAVALSLCLVLPAVVAGCKSDGRTLRPAAPDKTASISVPTTVTTIAGQVIDDQVAPTIPFKVQTPWADGGLMDARYTCAGADVSPPISWLGAPPDAVEMALVVNDLDADRFTHWVIAGLDPFNPSIPEGTVPVGAIEAANDFSTAIAPRIGWSGPCPPSGTTHTYRFTLYALSQQIELPTGTPAADLIAAIENTAVEATQISAVYTAG